MTFLTGTMTNGNPGAALYTILETAMFSDGWTLVDTVVIGSNTHKVLKSAAAGNARNLDWYLDINYPTTGTTGGIRFGVFEDYTVATHLGIRGPFGGSNSTVIDATTYSRFGATGSALETNWLNSASNSSMSQALTASSFTYYISVTRNRIVGIMTNNAQAMFYAGFFIPTTQHIAHTGSALYPLVCAGLTLNSGGIFAVSGVSAAGTAACLTRMPKYVTMPAQGWQQSVAINTSGPIATGMVGGSPSQATNEITIVPLTVHMGSSSVSVSSYQLNSFVGTLDGVCWGYSISSAVRGDTVTVGSDTWYMLTSASSMNAFMQAV